MDDLEWQELVIDINRDIEGIIASQRTLGAIHDELRERQDRPIEEDLITADALGQDPGAPKVITINGVEIQTRMLHRRGLKQRDIAGADLLYEIAGRKFVLVQYKTPNRQERVILDRAQLQELVGRCPNPRPPSRPAYFLTCGAWYAVRSPGDSIYVPACEALRRFGHAGSLSASRFGPGFLHEDFQQMFGRCSTGAQIDIAELTGLSREALESDRVLIDVLQRGSFGIWW